ncbi:MAG: hypothetical protein ACM3XM_13525 [Mycobacterium leprae]
MANSGSGAGNGGTVGTGGATNGGSIRIPKMNLMPYGIAYLHPRPAWRAVWLTVLLPGFGHFYAGFNLVGFVLMGWETLINTQAHLNLAIYYSLLGDGAKAAQVLRLDWAILYPFTYMYAMWDAYRVTVEGNKLCQLEERQPERFFERAKLNPMMGINFIDKRNPLIAVISGLLVGGLGHLYNYRAVKAIMLTSWHIAVMVLSRAHTALALTLTGQFEAAKQVVDYQWLLFLPSLVLFNAVNAYNDSQELNNLFDEEFEYRLRRYILNPSRPSPARRRQQAPYYLSPKQ